MQQGKVLPKTKVACNCLKTIFNGEWLYYKMFLENDALDVPIAYMMMIITYEGRCELDCLNLMNFPHSNISQVKRWCSFVASFNLFATDASFDNLSIRE